MPARKAPQSPGEGLYESADRLYKEALRAKRVPKSLAPYVGSIALSRVQEQPAGVVKQEVVVTPGVGAFRNDGIGVEFSSETDEGEGSRSKRWTLGVTVYPDGSTGTPTTAGLNNVGPDALLPHIAATLNDMHPDETVVKMEVVWPLPEAEETVPEPA